jgi:hypothetical protein
MFRLARILLLISILWTRPANADPKTETLFKQLNWETSRVTFDDGDVACLAEVANHDSSESMSLWRFRDTLRLQFYSEAWSFGEGEQADIDLKIDDLASWQMTNAELYKNSVLFDLPADENGDKLTMELRSGKTAVVTGDSAIGYRNYSLLGAVEAIPYLEGCFR